jgi:hypothetical protein
VQIGRLYVALIGVKDVEYLKEMDRFIFSPVSILILISLSICQSLPDKAGDADSVKPGETHLL